MRSSSISNNYHHLVRDGIKLMVFMVGHSPQYHQLTPSDHKLSPKWHQPSSELTITSTSTYNPQFYQLTPQNYSR